jgi:hypothetical protein
MKAGTAARDRGPKTGAAPHSALGLARNGGSAQSAAGTWAGAVSRDSSQSSSSITEPSAAGRAVGPDGRWGAARKRRRRAQTAVLAAWVRPGAGCWSRANVTSTRSASARQACAASPRSAVSGRDGHSSSCAPIPAMAANAHPASRAGTAEKGAGIVTSKMKVSIAAGPPQQVAVDDPGEQDRERDQGHGTGGEPGISGASRPEHHARRAGACQDGVGRPDGCAPGR